MPMSRAAPVIAEGFYDAYVCLQDRKLFNIYSGTFTSGDWRTRDLNYEQADPDGICALNANQIILAAGTYRCIISCPAYFVHVHRARLYNVTDSQVLLDGTNERSHSTWPNTTRSFIQGRFSVLADKTLEVQHRCGTTRATYGFGYLCGFHPTDEIYTIAEFWREI